MTKDQKNVESQVETDTFFEKVEKATPTQVSQAVIAQVMKKLKRKTTTNDLTV